MEIEEVRAMQKYWGQFSLSINTETTMYEVFRAGFNHGIIQKQIGQTNDIAYLAGAVVDCRLAVIRADELIKKHKIEI